MTKKKRELTDLQKRLLTALADPENKGNIRHCMRLAGYNDNTQVSDVLDSLHEEMVEVANRMLASGSVRAALELIGVFDDPNEMGVRNKLTAAKEILDRAGVKSKENDGNVTVNTNGGGIIILPAKGSMDEDDDQ